METHTAPVIDASVHPNMEHPDQLLDYMKEPWRSRVYPKLTQYFYPAPTGIPPFGEYATEAREPHRLPGSDPDTVWAALAGMGIHKAVLLPLTRGLIEVEKNNQICAATNEWLAAEWLDRGETADRYYGTIRVNPEDPESAVREIERWADHPKMVQVGVPLEAHKPYGQRLYHKIWETAARHELPVAVHRDTASGGFEFYPTPNGYPTYYIEYNTMYPLNFVYHLSSLIAEGVLANLPSLRFVFTDGGHDLVTPLTWRQDADWIGARVEIPWVKKRPTEYLDQIRFVMAPFEGPIDDHHTISWLEITGGDSLLMYGSSYPHSISLSPVDVFPTVPASVRATILGANAADLYNIEPMPGLR